MPRPKIKPLWQTLESMEKLHMDAIGRAFTEDEAEDFRSYTLTSIAQLCAVLDDHKSEIEKLKKK